MADANKTSQVVRSLDQNDTPFSGLVRVKDEDWQAISKKYKKMEAAVTVALTWLEDHRSFLKARTDEDGGMQIDLLYSELAEALAFDPLSS